MERVEQPAAQRCREGPGGRTADKSDGPRATPAGTPTTHRAFQLFRYRRGTYEGQMPLDGPQTFDADCMVRMMQSITERIAQEGNAVVVGRGSPYFLRGRSDTFRVFLYAPRDEKLRRIVAGGISTREAEDLVDTVDRERMTFIKHYFNADWPTRALYHVMLNTVVGDEYVISTILNIMRQLKEGSPVSEAA